MVLKWDREKKEKDLNFFVCEKGERSKLTSLVHSSNACTGLNLARLKLGAGNWIPFSLEGDSIPATWTVTNASQGLHQQETGIGSRTGA